jgi:plasmid replication initiation protein
MSGELDTLEGKVIVDTSTPESLKVTMSNALVRAGHGLSLSEKRLIMMSVATLDSRKLLKPGEVPITRIRATDYAEQFQIDPDTAYDQLRAAEKSLYNRSITFFEASHRRKGKPLDLTMVRMRWVGQVKYHKTEGWVELHWWPPLLPHLCGLKNQFTSYQLAQASGLRSMHSWRLLELIERFTGTGWAQYSIEDFAVAMDATVKQRGDFAKIRTKIIEPSVRELNEKDGWAIEWEPVKAGRKVVALRFKFKKDPQGRLNGVVSENGK